MLAQIDMTWPSLLIQGGAFALLTYIVTVMAPKILAASISEREARDLRFIAAIELLNSGFAERARETSAAAELQAKILASAVNTQSQTLAKEVKVQNDLIVAALGTVCKLKEPR